VTSLRLGARHHELRLGAGGSCEGASARARRGRRTSCDSARQCERESRAAALRLSAGRERAGPGGDELRLGGSTQGRERTGQRLSGSCGGDERRRAAAWRARARSRRPGRLRLGAPVRNADRDRTERRRAAVGAQCVRDATSCSAARRSSRGRRYRRGRAGIAGGRTRSQPHPKRKARAPAGEPMPGAMGYPGRASGERWFASAANVGLGSRPAPLKGRAHGTARPRTTGTRLLGAACGGSVDQYRQSTGHYQPSYGKVVVSFRGNPEPNPSEASRGIRVFGGPGTCAARAAVYGKCVLLVIVLVRLAYGRLLDRLGDRSARFRRTPIGKPARYSSAFPTYLYTPRVTRFSGPPSLANFEL
jgi:hypothetical protein